MSNRSINRPMGLGNLNLRTEDGSSIHRTPSCLPGSGKSSSDNQPAAVSFPAVSSLASVADTSSASVSSSASVILG